MAYTKKIWVNVPNASELTEEELNALIPENEEGIKQDSLARFDADNMNRIEGGIQEAIDAPKCSIIVDATSGAKTIQLTLENSNTEWRYVYASGISSLKIESSETLSNNEEAYYSVVFTSGTYATTITNSLGVYFTGDDCVDGMFIPSSTKTYDVGIWWNGLSWQAIVRGV